MDIILLERIEKLGGIGDVVSVKDGYARNFLLPNKKALRANESNRKVFEANRSKIEADEAELQAQGVDVMKAMFEEASVPAGFTEAQDRSLEPGEIPADMFEEAPAEGEQA